MSKYDSYFLMKAEEVPAYVQEKLSFFPSNHELESKEIGDKLKAKFANCYNKEVNDLMAKTEGFQEWYKERMPADGVKVFNPAFDVTDNDLITGIITEYGIARPPYSKSLKVIFENKKSALQNK